MRRNRSFWLIISLLLLLGLGAAGAGAAGLVTVAGRHPSQAQITAAGQREFAVLWQRLGAGQIFPPSVSYLSTPGAETKATLVGIAPQAPCGTAVDAKAAAALEAAGCCRSAFPAPWPASSPARRARRRSPSRPPAGTSSSTPPVTPTAGRRAWTAAPGGESVTTDLGVGVLAGLINVFKAPANPCTDKNVRC